MEAFVADLKEVLKNVYAWSNDCNTWPSEVKEIIANMMFNMGLPRMNGFVKLKYVLNYTILKEFFLLFCSLTVKY